MRDLIDRQDAIKAIVSMTTISRNQIQNLCNASVADAEGFIGGINEAIKALEALPSAEPERKKGRWIYDTERVWHDGGIYAQYHCSECGFQIIGSLYNYCQNCGADMRGKRGKNEDA